MKEFMILMFMFFCAQAMALTTKTVECQYNNGNDSIAFTTVGEKFQTERVHGGHKVKVSVVNINKPSDSDDYISFSKEGRTMTFPLNCKKI
jgi:hypothetical protein